MIKDTTLKQLLEVLEMRSYIVVFDNNEELVYQGQVYGFVAANEENKIMKFEVEAMYISLGTVNIKLSDKY